MKIPEEHDWLSSNAALPKARVYLTKSFRVDWNDLDIICRIEASEAEHTGYVTFIGKTSDDPRSRIQTQSCPQDLSLSIFKLRRSLVMEVFPKYFKHGSIFILRSLVRLRHPIMPSNMDLFIPPPTISNCGLSRLHLLAPSSAESLYGKEVVASSSRVHVTSAETWAHIHIRQRLFSLPAHYASFLVLWVLNF